MELSGKTAIVTGASSGIGAATVRRLREAGVRVVGGARRVERIEADVALPLDVTDDVPPGVVASEKGAWLATSRTGQTISALVSADMRADLAEGACFNDTRVEVSLSLREA